MNESIAADEDSVLIMTNLNGFKVLISKIFKRSKAMDMRTYEVLLDVMIPLKFGVQKIPNSPFETEI